MLRKWIRMLLMACDCTTTVKSSSCRKKLSIQKMDMNEEMEEDNRMRMMGNECGTVMEMEHRSTTKIRMAWENKGCDDDDELEESADGKGEDGESDVREAELDELGVQSLSASTRLRWGSTMRVGVGRAGEERSRIASPLLARRLFYPTRFERN